jgi:EpsI family protein
MDKKYIIIIILLVLAGFASWKNYFQTYRQKDTVSIHSFPEEIQGWTSEEIPMTEKEYAILETKNTFVRKYTSPDESKTVFLYVVYSQTNRRVAHEPELCYSGGGMTLVKKFQDTFTSGGRTYQAQHLRFEQGNRKDIVFYWFKVGDTFTASYLKQQILIAVKSLLGQPRSSALIRLSAVVLDHDTDKAVRDIKEFAGLIVPHLEQHLP